MDICWLFGERQAFEGALRMTNEHHRLPNEDRVACLFNERSQTMEAEDMLGGHYECACMMGPGKAP